MRAIPWNAKDLDEATASTAHAFLVDTNYPLIAVGAIALCKWWRASKKDRSRWATTSTILLLPGILSALWHHCSLHRETVSSRRLIRALHDTDSACAVCSAGYGIALITGLMRSKSSHTPIPLTVFEKRSFIIMTLISLAIYFTASKVRNRINEVRVHHSASNRRQLSRDLVVRYAKLHGAWHLLGHATAVYYALREGIDLPQV